MVSAMAMDSVLGAVFVAARPQSRPSWVYKINATTLITYGIVKLRDRAGVALRPAASVAPAACGIVAKHFACVL